MMLKLSLKFFMKHCSKHVLNVYPTSPLTLQLKKIDLPWTKICVNSYVAKIVYGPDTWRPKIFSNTRSIANVEIKSGL